MSNNHEQFSPDMVDEQIDQLLQRGENPSETSTAEEQIVPALQQIYSTDNPRLKRVWERLATYTTEKSEDTESRKQPIPIQHVRREGVIKVKHEPLPVQVKRKQRLSLLISGLVALLVIASTFAIAVAIKQHGSQAEIGSRPSPIVTTPGLYMAGSTIYRRDIKTGATIWTYALPADIPDGGTQQKSPPEVVVLKVDGKSVYIEATDNKIYALDAEKGMLHWSRPLPGYISTAPGTTIVVANNTLYVNGRIETINGRDQSDIYALDTKNGNIKRSYSIDAFRVIKGIQIDRAAYIIVANNVLYVSLTHSRGIYALNIPDGKILWRTSFTTAGGGPLHIVGNTVYVSIASATSTPNTVLNQLYALKANTGQIIWQAKMSADSPSIDFNVVDGTIYCSTYNQVYAYNRQSGKLLWRTDVKEIYRDEGGPKVDNGTVYVMIGASSPIYSQIALLNALDGHIKQTYTFDDTHSHGKNKPKFEKLAVRDGTLYFTIVNGGILFAVRADKSVIFQVPVGENGPYKLAVVS